MKFLDEEVVLHFATYVADNTLCIQMRSLENGEPIAMCTVCVPGAQLKKDEVAVKDWNENEGILQFLIDNKIVEPPHRQHLTGYVLVDICKLIPDDKD